MQLLNVIYFYLVFKKKPQQHIDPFEEPNNSLSPASG